MPITSIWMNSRLKDLFIESNKSVNQSSDEKDMVV